MAPNDSDRKPSPDEPRPELPAHTHTFTAVNGTTAAVINGRSSPMSNEGQTKREPTPSTPTDDPHRMNGIIHHGPSPGLSNSSPSINDSTGPGQADTPESQRSPPIRKRSYPEAFPEMDRRDESPHRHGAEHYRTPDYARRSHEDQDSSMEREREHTISGDVDPHAPMGQSYYPSRSQTVGDSEQRLAAAALRRESETSSARKELPPVLPNSEDQTRQLYSDYDQSRSAVQVDREGKRRKRIFSNRTKTGCMTCRKRKKKCDEQHPECECYSFYFFPLMIRLILHRWLKLHCLCVRRMGLETFDSAYVWVVVSRCLWLLRLPWTAHISDSTDHHVF